MSLSSSLSAGVSGLLTNSARLATISDNIANSSTFGYKRADLEFASLVNATTSSGFSAGGVRGEVFRQIADTGSLTGTGNATDLAVGGRGMLPVTETDRLALPANERPFLLTPTGSFTTNEDGFVTTKTGLTLLGFPTDSAGNLIGSVVRDGTDSLEPVQVSPFINAAQQSTSISLGVNLPARETVEGGVFAPFESPIQYFDSIGRGNTLTVRYTPVDPGAGNPPSNAWTVEFFDSAGPDPASRIAALDLVFDDTAGGRLLDPGGVTEIDITGEPGEPTGYNPVTFDPLTGTMTVQAADGDVPLEIFIGSPNPSVQGGLSQLDAEFAPTNIIKDGAPAGTLSGLEVDEKGILLGIYDTGQRVALFQIPIADVPNFNGLTPQDNQTFALSPNSGNLFLHDANSGPVGSLESFALQESTVDVAQELTNLIKTQRAYSSNATVIQTVDEMLQETTNLKR